MRSGPRTVETQAIFRFIQENEPVPQKQLADHFRSQAAAAGMSINVWLGRRIDAMCEADFVHYGARGWTAAADVELHDPVAGGRRSRKHRAQASPPPPPADPHVAQPRRIDTFGPAYVPPATVHREGAQDYARYPSVINGQQRSYRRAW